MIYKNFSKRQLIAMTWWNRPGMEDYDGILCDGAVRSGKTVSLCVGFFLWSMSRFDGGDFALCGRTIGALQRHIVSHLPQWLGGLFRFRFCKSENKLTVIGGGRQNVYYLFGGADESAASLICCSFSFIRLSFPWGEEFVKNKKTRPELKSGRGENSLAVPPELKAKSQPLKDL